MFLGSSHTLPQFRWWPWMSREKSSSCSSWAHSSNREDFFSGFFPRSFKSLSSFLWMLPQPGNHGKDLVASLANFFSFWLLYCLFVAKFPWLGSMGFWYKFTYMKCLTSWTQADFMEHRASSATECGVARPGAWHGAAATGWDGWSTPTRWAPEN